MKKENVLALTLGIILAASAAFAGPRFQSATSNPPQEPAAQAPGHPDALENDTALNLTQEQKDKIKSIHEDAKQQMLAVKKDTTLSADDQQAKIRQIRNDTRTQVLSVLTPDQRKTLAAEMRERQAGNANKGEKPPESAPQPQ